MGIDDRPRLPAREGTRPLDRVDAPRLSPPRRLAPGPPSELAADFVFFNHGLLFTAGGLAGEQNPAWRHWETRGLPVDEFPQPVLFPEVLVRGIGRTIEEARWDRLLFAVLKEHWPGLGAALRATTGVDWGARTAWAAAEVGLLLPDPVWRREHPLADPPRTFPAFYYGVNSNRRRYGFRQFSDPARTGSAPPHYAVIAGEPDDDDVRFAEQLFGESDTPFRVLEPTAFPDDLPRPQLPDLD